ncbi:hypothetical protein [Deinococcus hohokamensis]|uniref:N-acetyltransferase domain-containing protein n=1 Tax=Deinococcus hohokamensis TaxID=309883 RepID=A0ABV9I692_9DEIO
MGATIRAGRREDVPHLVEVKSRLPLNVDDTGGGFLLGASAEEYRRRVDEGAVWILEVQGGVMGFSVTLGHKTLQREAFWTPQRASGSTVDLAAFVGARPVAYVDQLAVLPGARAHAPRLAYVTLSAAVQAHDVVLATTVDAPVRNRAALPLLRAAGFVPLGTLTEQYGALSLRSVLHAVTRERYAAHREQPLFQAFLRKTGELPPAGAPRGRAAGISTSALC